MPKRAAKQPLVRVALSNAAKLINSESVRNSLGTVRMSSCAAKLAAAIADPFSEEAKGACFPSFPAPDSHKVQAFTRFTGHIGTLGEGFIAFNPCLGRDAPSIWHSTAAYDSTNIAILSALNTYATGVSALGHNGPYTVDQLITTANPPLISGRVVAVGARVTFTGTNLNESGTITLLSEPSHSNLTGLDLNGLQIFSEANICPFTKKPCSLSMFPASVAESEYPAHGASEISFTGAIYPYCRDTQFFLNSDRTASRTYVQAFGGTNVTLGAPMACIAVTGVPGQSFHVDVVYHLEYTGPGVAAAATPNSVDVSSVYAILTSAAQLSTRKMAHPNERPWKLLMDGIRSAMGSPVALTARGILRI